MKKFAVLFVAFIAFAVVSPAVARHRPEIVNPPRPTKHWKYLVVVKHTIAGEMHIHYVYTDKYYFTKVGGGIEMVTVGTDEGCVRIPQFPKDAANCSISGMQYTGEQWLSNPHVKMKLLGIFVSPAPKPGPHRASSKNEVYRISPIDVKLQKAKVVFRKR